MEAITQCIERNFGVQGIEIEDLGTGQGQIGRYKVRCGPLGYIAKHLRPRNETELSWVGFECRFVSHLGRAGLPIAEPLRTVDEKQYAVFEDRPLLLYPWVEGCIEWPTSEGNAERLGAALAGMHNESKGLDHLPGVRTYDVDRLVDRPMRLLQQFLHPASDEFTRLRELTDALKERVRAVRLDADTFGPIHGDIHQGNCIFSSTGGLVVFDFALCGIGYRVYDLTGYLWPMRDATIDDPRMRECCSAFLRGYRGVRYLTPEEEEAIPAFVQIRSLWETGDWVDTGTGREQSDEVRKSISYLVKQFASANLKP